MTANSNSMNERTNLDLPEAQILEIQYLSQRLDGIESKLDALIAMLSETEGSEWITNNEATELLCISERQLLRLVENDVIQNDAVRNIGTGKNPCFMYHRTKMMNQYLKRVAKTH